MKYQECAKCGKRIAKSETVCPCCLKETAEAAAHEFLKFGRDTPGRGLLIGISRTYSGRMNSSTA